MASAPTRIKSLDGVRALAILSVILTHIQQQFAVFHIPVPVVDGVELFFVLSGFLITSMLLREAGGIGGIHLPHFYLRRATRILPPLLAYLCVVVVGFRVLGLPAPWAALGSSALFAANFYSQNPPATQHLWSLAVEEQFYLLWPLLLLACLRWGGRRAAGRAAVTLLLISPVFRTTVSVFHLPWINHREQFSLPGRMDSLLAGALLALLLGTPAWERFYERTGRYRFVAPLFFFAISPALRLLLGNLYTLSLGFTLESLAAALFFGSLLRNPGSLVSRALGWRPFAFFGVASYSIYLYQSAIILCWPTAWGGGHPAVAAFLTAVLAGLLAYLLVEVPVAFLRNRKPVRVLQGPVPSVPVLPGQGEASTL